MTTQNWITVATRSGKKVHLASTTSAVTVCGRWLKVNSQAMKVDAPATCEKCVGTYDRQRTKPVVNGKAAEETVDAPAKAEKADPQAQAIPATPTESYQTEDVERLRETLAENPGAWVCPSIQAVIAADGTLVGRFLDVTVEKATILAARGRDFATVDDASITGWRLVLRD